MKVIEREKTNVYDGNVVVGWMLEAVSVCY
jgi:hypothetical protein